MKQDVDLSIRNNRSKARKLWISITRRVDVLNLNQRNYAYRNCSICENWRSFESFYNWFKDNHIEGFQIDKDILFKGNKVYSPDNCCFVPAFINSLFTKSDKIRGEYAVGVDKQNNKYRARIKKKINGKRIRIDLGRFDSEEKAFCEYKKAKESYIKEVAEEFKDVIDEKVYNAMYNYKVEIND